MRSECSVELAALPSDGQGEELAWSNVQLHGVLLWQLGHIEYAGASHRQHGRSCIVDWAATASGEDPMHTTAVIFGLGAATAIGALLDASVAGPSSGLRFGAAASSQVEQIDYRQCWMRDGRHCRLVRSGGGSDDDSIPAYGAGGPESYRVGGGVISGQGTQRQT